MGLLWCFSNTGFWRCVSERVSDRLRVFSFVPPPPSSLFHTVLVFSRTLEEWQKRPPRPQHTRRARATTTRQPTLQRRCRTTARPARARARRRQTPPPPPQQQRQRRWRSTWATCRPTSRSRTCARCLRRAASWRAARSSRARAATALSSTRTTPLPRPSSPTLSVRPQLPLHPRPPRPAHTCPLSLSLSRFPHSEPARAPRHAPQDRARARPARRLVLQLPRARPQGARLPVPREHRRQQLAPQQHPSQPLASPQPQPQPQPSQSESQPQSPQSLAPLLAPQPQPQPQSELRPPPQPQPQPQPPGL